jgi:hypothetical protein
MPQEASNAMTFSFFAMLFVALAVITAALALYRKIVSLREDDYIHIGSGEEKLIPQQVEIANRLRLLDRCGEILTVLTAAYGLILSLLYMYHRFQAY